MIKYFILRAWFWITGDCGHICGYQEPYGFVPEADCSIHDSAEYLHTMRFKRSTK